MDHVDQSEDMGWLDWEISDMNQAVTIHEGSRIIKRGDFTFDEPPRISWPRDKSKPWPYRIVENFVTRQKHHRQQIHLDGGFYLCISGATPSGFGMAAKRRTSSTFSFEWFEFIDEQHARKLQERGALEIRMDGPSDQREVTFTKFLSDVSFRVIVPPVGCLPALGLAFQGIRPHWRVNIRQGSYVTWPPFDGGSVPTMPSN